MYAYTEICIDGKFLLRRVHELVLLGGLKKFERVYVYIQNVKRFLQLPFENQTANEYAYGNVINYVE